MNFRVIPKLLPPFYLPFCSFHQYSASPASIYQKLLDHFPWGKSERKKKKKSSMFPEGFCCHLFNCSCKKIDTPLYFTWSGALITLGILELFLVIFAWQWDIETVDCYMIAPHYYLQLRISGRVGHRTRICHEPNVFIGQRPNTPNWNCYRPHPNYGEGTVFTGMCLSTSGGRVGTPSHNTSTGPRSFPGGTPVAGPRSLLGVP